MNRLWGNSRRMARIVSTPFRPGMRRSISVTSGRCWRNSRCASSPLRASATSDMSGSVPIMVAKPSRTTGWSSTTMMRIAAAPVIRGRPSCHGDLDHDLRPLAGTAEQAQLAAQVLHALADAGEAEVAGGALRRLFHVESAPVVAHAQPHEPLAEAQLHAHLLGVGVSDGVGQSLLSDAEEVVLHLRRKPPAAAAHPHRDLGLAAELLGDLYERAAEVGLFQRRRPQRPHPPPRFGPARAHPD